MEKFLNGSIALENPYAGDGWNRGMAAIARNTVNPISPIYSLIPPLRFCHVVMIMDKVAKNYRQKYLIQNRYKY